MTDNYRYELRRDWLGGHLPPLVWIMLNPSTADALADDPTIRRCIGFATRWGHSGIQVANLYAARATKPTNLWREADPVGPMADTWLIRHLDAAEESKLVVAWGVHARPTRVARFVELLGGRQAWCLGVTAGGQPRHPLFVPYDTSPELWRHK